MNILFVCTGNTCRSPMAKALFLKQIQGKRGMLPAEDINVFSAGLFTQDNLAASPHAIKAMEEEGLDISMHRSASLRTTIVRLADLILTMTISQRDYLMEKFPDKAELVYTLSEFTGDKSAEVLDPYGQDLSAYRESLFQLKLLVDRLINKIIESR